MKKILATVLSAGSTLKPKENNNYQSNNIHVFLFVTDHAYAQDMNGLMKWFNPSNAETTFV